MCYINNTKVEDLICHLFFIVFRNVSIKSYVFTALLNYILT